MRPTLLTLLLVACGGPADDTADTGDTDVPEGCRDGDPRPDEVRYGLVSHPYGTGGAQADAWEVVSFQADGSLARGTPFTMGRGNGRPVRFAPDGSLAVAVQEDGSLGIVALDAQGAPTVIATGFADDGDGGEFYAVDVAFDRGGERLWVVDGNWVENGGGVYAVDLDCATGEPTAAGLVAPSKLASHLLPLPDGRHVLVADEALDSGPGEHVHLLDLAGPTRIDGAYLWPDDDAIVGGAALAGDGNYVLIGDNSAFSSVPNRVAVARLDGDDLAPVQTLSNIEDPVAIAAWGAATLVASGYGDALVQLRFDPEGSPPFANLGDLPTTGGSPQLPGAVATAAAPGGHGWMLVAEVEGVRVIAADPAGSLDDQGVFSFGSGLPAMVGSVGLQP